MFLDWKKSLVLVWIHLSQTDSHNWNISISFLSGCIWSHRTWRFVASECCCCPIVTVCNMFHVCFVFLFVFVEVCVSIYCTVAIVLFFCFFVFHSHELAVYNGKKCMAFTTSTHLNNTLSMKFNVIILHVSSLVTNSINIKPLKWEENAHVTFLWICCYSGTRIRQSELGPQKWLTHTKTILTVTKIHVKQTAGLCVSWSAAEFPLKRFCF